ncbi:hypothetical protein [Motiliproteus sediminis]|uniref:hypothetical protein n=1 Tax=Motiliproteus sediminis TaxID=1468178 RepID=UPI001AEFE9F8|nr:hypothetical protein [Motiliproteus sediminis]
MNPTAKTLIIALSTVAALNVGAAHAGSPVFGYKPIKIDYNGSFNTNNDVRTRIDNSKRVDTDTRLNYDLDNSVRYKLSNKFDYDLRYDYRQDNIGADQAINQYRNYSSDVGQNAGNVGGASGHSMSQSQGDTNVGALVKERSYSSNRGHSLLSPSFSSHSGSTHTGNMSGSQIGAGQSGVQVGDVTNVQSNDQQQTASSYTGSIDWVGNSASK